MNESHPGSESFQERGRRPDRDQLESVEDPLEGFPSTTHNVGNVPVEFFGIGALAGVLGRKAGTVRKWENDGVLPRATYQVGGHDSRARRRLYTRRQIIGVWRIARDEGLIGTSKHIKSTKFVELVKEGWPFDN